MFPTEDPNQFAQQWLRAYSLTQGLICIGDDEACRRKIDTATGTMASHTTEDWVWKEGLQCDPQECSEYLSRRCRRVMNLQFLLPDVNLCGRISFIPLTLTLEPREVSPPGEKKKVVRVLGIRSDIKLAELQAYGQREPARILLPEPEVEGVPDDSFPTEVLAEEELEPLVEPEPLEAPILNREELIEELAMLLRDQME